MGRIALALATLLGLVALARFAPFLLVGLILAAIALASVMIVYLPYLVLAVALLVVGLIVSDEWRDRRRPQ